MIDLTPLDVRKKRGDFRKLLRGYDPEEVDIFLDLVAERMEVLVKENLTLTERVERLGEQVEAQEGRETAVREALVTAQELRTDMRTQASKEADLLLREAASEAEHAKREAASEVDRIVAEAERLVRERLGALEELERQRQKFLKAFRAMLERELDAVVVEEGRTPLEDVTLEIDLSGGRRRGEVDASEPDGEEPVPEPEEEATKAELEPVDEPDGEAWDEAEVAEELPEEAPVEVEVAEEVEVEEVLAEEVEVEEVLAEEVYVEDFVTGREVVEEVAAEEVIVEAEDGDFEEMEDPEVVIEEPKRKQGSGDEPLWLSSLLNHQSRKDEE